MYLPEEEVRVLFDEKTRMWEKKPTLIDISLNDNRDPRREKERRVAMSDKDLKELLFKLFHSKSEWTLEEINEKLDQPEGPVKRALFDICECRGKRYSLKNSYQF